VASGARLATACAAVSALAGWAALHPRLRRPALATALVGGVAISLATALVPLPPDALTQRATLWARARDLVVESPLVGHGLSSWVRAAATSPPPTASYSPHNVWLEPAVAMGIGGVVVLVAVIGVGWALCRPEARTAVTLLLIGILVAGAFEATAMPVRIGPVPAGFPLLLLMLTAGQRDLSAVRDIALPSRARPCR
jgi:exopolysaccharide production protein ExoQ